MSSTKPKSSQALTRRWLSSPAIAKVPTLSWMQYSSTMRRSRINASQSLSLMRSAKGVERQRSLDLRKLYRYSKDKLFCRRRPHFVELQCIIEPIDLDLMKGRRLADSG